MTDPEKFSPPKEEGLDKLISGFRAFSSIVSIVPGMQWVPIPTELGLQFLGSPYQKRLEQWMEMVGETLQEIMTQKKLGIEDLQKNQLLFDYVLKTTPIALRNNHEIKKEALKRIIQNAATPDPDEVFLQAALHFIDNCTGWHFLILKFLANPKAWETENDRKIPRVLGMDLYFVIKEAYPELKPNSDLLEQILIDLWNWGLIDSHPDRDTLLKDAAPSLENLMERNITNMGIRLLAILSP